MPKISSTRRLAQPSTDRPARQNPVEETNPVEEIAVVPPAGTLPHLPLIDIFSKSPSDVKNLLEQINAILRQRLKNEFIIAEALDEGLSSEKLNFHDAVKMHNGSKDSIGDLVKIKNLLEGGGDPSIVINIIGAKSEIRVDTDELVHGYRAQVSADN